ncbi:hypothetical protein ACLQ3B_24960 [Micromonospora sp. DT53]|uniref:hypothetical protein n=1 Tax=Micromonospora sp. DT53 TaxID=3393444 RepID=UPI003CECC528
MAFGTLSTLMADLVLALFRESVGASTLPKGTMCDGADHRGIHHAESQHRQRRPQAPVGQYRIRSPLPAIAAHEGLHAWGGWAFDHSGGNPEPQLLTVNADVEGQPLMRLKITEGLGEFCE